MSGDFPTPIKVSYERKTEIKVEQPEDVTRAKAGAWLDVISPVTEWLGLKGDVLRNKRTLMRLEQEASLFELAEKLRPKLEGKTVTPIPTKQLLPALEKASLERPGSDFIEKWANLLASAALSPGDDVAICTSILGDIGPTEAGMLDVAVKHLASADLWTADKIRTRHLAWNIFINAEYSTLETILADFCAGTSEWTTVGPALNVINERSPNIITQFHFAAHLGEQKSVSMGFTESQLVAIDVLKYRNLIGTESYFELLNLTKRQGRPFRGTLTVNFQYLTDLGVTFLRRVSPIE